MGVVLQSLRVDRNSLRHEAGLRHLLLLHSVQHRSCLIVLTPVDGTSSLAQIQSGLATLLNRRTDWSLNHSCADRCPGLMLSRLNRRGCHVYGGSDLTAPELDLGRVVLKSLFESLTR